MITSILDSAMSVSSGMSGLSLGSIKSIKSDQAFRAETNCKNFKERCSLKLDEN